MDNLSLPRDNQLPWVATCIPKSLLLTSGLAFMIVCLNAWTATCLGKPLVLNSTRTGHLIILDCHPRWTIIYFGNHSPSTVTRLWQAFTTDNRSYSHIEQSYPVSSQCCGQPLGVDGDLPITRLGWLFTMGSHLLWTAIATANICHSRSPGLKLPLILERNSTST